jgi:hypothetical protein
VFDLIRVLNVSSRGVGASESFERLVDMLADSHSRADGVAINSQSCSMHTNCMSHKL